MLNIGRGGFLWLKNADVVENTTMTLPKGSRDLRSLRVLRNFRLRMRTPNGTPKGIKCPSVTYGSHVTTVLLLRKTRGEKRGMRRTYFRSGPLLDRSSSGHVTFSLPIKRPPRADIAQLPVAHAQNILPDRTCDFRSRHFRSCAMVRPSARSSTNTTWAVPIYYFNNFNNIPWPVWTQYHTDWPWCITNRETTTIISELINIEYNRKQ
jgi:hypothetical protein